MYSLRMFLSEPLQTNVEIGKFTMLEGNPTCHVCHVEDVAIPESATLQLYPGNAQKDCFYSIEPDSQLYVFTDNGEFKGRVMLKDEYLYFKINVECIAIYVIVCKSKTEAEARFRDVL